MDVCNVWVHDDAGVRSIASNISDRNSVFLMAQTILAIVSLLIALIFLARRMRQTFSKRKGGGCGPSCGCG